MQHLDRWGKALRIARVDNTMRINKPVTIHLLDLYFWVAPEMPRSIPCTYRCGAPTEGSATRFTWPNNEKLEPTCEACILIHFADPIGTEYIDSYHNTAALE